MGGKHRQTIKVLRNEPTAIGTTPTVAGTAPQSPPPPPYQHPNPHPPTPPHVSQPSTSPGTGMLLGQHRPQVASEHRPHAVSRAQWDGGGGGVLGCCFLPPLPAESLLLGARGVKLRELFNKQQTAEGNALLHTCQSRQGFVCYSTFLCLSGYLRG